MSNDTDFLLCRNHLKITMTDGDFLSIYFYIFNEIFLKFKSLAVVYFTSNMSGDT